MTVTVNEHDAWLPLLSVAVTVTEVVPIGNCPVDSCEVCGFGVWMVYDMTGVVGWSRSLTSVAWASGKR